MKEITPSRDISLYISIQQLPHTESAANVRCVVDSDVRVCYHSLSAYSKTQ